MNQYRVEDEYGNIVMTINLDIEEDVQEELELEEELDFSWEISPGITNRLRSIHRNQNWNQHNLGG